MEVGVKLGWSDTMYQARPLLISSFMLSLYCMKIMNEKFDFVIELK